MGQSETSRLKLQTILENLMRANGKSPNVYFQPPENLNMAYPCIVYKRQYIGKTHADNIPYLVNRQYRVTYIDRSPNGDVIDALINLNNCRYVSNYVANGLNHDAFEIYY